MALCDKAWHYSEIINKLTELRTEKLNKDHNPEALKWLIGQEIITCLARHASPGNTLPATILGIVYEIIPGQDIKLIDRPLIGQDCRVTFEGVLINATPNRS